MAKQSFVTGQVLTAAQLTSLQQTAMGGGSATAKTANYVLVAADAGTTVAMDAAGTTTITVDTGLFAVGDSVTIQNRGAGICTVTAGTATVATAGSLALGQNEGGILYFTATGAAVFYDFVQAASSSGGMTLLSTTTLSGVSTTISSIDQTYVNLFVVITGVTGNTANSQIRVRPNNSTSSNYVKLADSSAPVDIKGEALGLTSDNALRTSANNAWAITFNNYASASSYKPFSYSGSFTTASLVQSVAGFGAHISNTAISSLVVDFGGSNTLAGGTVLIYGVK
jgi:hypothetical protein